ncbi:arylsulfatase [Amycolatopsis acidicola]|uniref:Arylsulfatase n=1 Tax=Amycolatopsis acidicola TaxID=2596893 RepID=A0A5N0UTX0_9PSEU|nr:arylsulfatase [Amycolatopsis acidicola]KAA9153598.1 arylsulfatase [Amycolatopsis acidicola]
MTTASEPGHVGTTYADSRPWWPEPPRPPEGSPDIILVVLDDVGFGTLGCYGSEIATPAIDALAGNGLRYTNFHVTPLCSPTRASLLTGRNHHSVGMSLLSNADSGFPSKRGTITPHAATVAEVLKDNGYSTACYGKWHLAPLDQTSSVGPFDQWPLARGFERYYGFLEGISDQFYPELVQDNQRVEPPKTPEEGYHLTEDLVDHAIDFVSDQKSSAPDKPYFLYLALGTAHTPHQAPREYLERVRGRYDQGWDEVRAARHAEQLRAGVIPPGTDLAPRNDSVVPWDELPADDRRVMARMQEAFAAMVEHTDDQLARLFAHLERLGTRENTMIVLMSDNGASQEGGRDGTVNTIAYENGDSVTTAQNLAGLDEIGGPRNHSNYPWGWAQAANTPLKRYKQNTHAGGVRAPLVVSWPRGITDSGLRSQFHHVIDVAPTILDLVGADMPELRHGLPQLPVHGTSLRYTFGGADETTRRGTQYFEMYGHRAIWHEGWKAVAYHERGTSYDDDVWELYHLDEDFSECHNLAAQHPEVLQNLIGRWWSEAARYDVFPLDDRNFAERAARYHSASSPRRRRSYRYYPGMTRVPGGITPLIYDRSFTIEAAVDMTAGDEGVLVAHGDVCGGHVLYVRNGQLHYEYNHQGTRYHVAGPLHGSPERLAMRFTKTGQLCGKASLWCDDSEIGVGTIASTARFMIGWQGLTIGRDSLSPVSWDYPRGFAFTGALRHLDFTLADDGPFDVHEVID